MLFSVEKAARLAGVPRDTLREWMRRELVRPRHGDVELFCFRDVVALKTLAILHEDHEVPLGGKRGLLAFSRWLHSRFNEPWSSLRFSVAGREVMFQQDGDLVSSFPPGQLAMRGAPFGVERVEASVKASVQKMERRTGQAAAVNPRTRIIVGTRVMSSSVFAMHQAGMTPKRIVQEFPSLREADVAAAIAFEQKKRRAA